MFGPPIFPPPLRARQPGQAGPGRAPVRIPVPPPGWGGPGPNGQARPAPPPVWPGPILNGPQPRPGQQHNQFGQPVLLPLFAGAAANAVDAFQNGLNMLNGMNDGPHNNGPAMMQNLRQTARTLDGLRRMQI